MYSWNANVDFILLKSNSLPLISTGAETDPLPFKWIPTLEKSSSFL